MNNLELKFDLLIEQLLERDWPTLSDVAQNAGTIESAAALTRLFVRSAGVQARAVSLISPDTQREFDYYAGLLVLLPRDKRDGWLLKIAKLVDSSSTDGHITQPVLDECLGVSDEMDKWIALRHQQRFGRKGGTVEDAKAAIRNDAARAEKDFQSYHHPASPHRPPAPKEG